MAAGGATTAPTGSAAPTALTTGDQAAAVAVALADGGEGRYLALRTQAGATRTGDGAVGFSHGAERLEAGLAIRTSVLIKRHGSSSRSKRFWNILIQPG